jgi:alkylation response protein AidB-like acyl-CoA dehydrogenase
VVFDNARVPAPTLWAQGQGFRIAMAGLDGGRINIGACSLGARRCLDEALAYVKGAASSARRWPISRTHSSSRHGDRTGSGARCSIWPPPR